MTKIVFDLFSVAGRSHSDDAVTFRAPFMRKSTITGGIVTTRRERIEAPAGTETVDVEPGPIEIEVWAAGESRKLTFNVPDTDTIYLSDYVETAIPLEPSTVNDFRIVLTEVKQRAKEFTAFAERAEAFTTTIEGYIEETTHANETIQGYRAEITSIRNDVIEANETVQTNTTATLQAAEQVATNTTATLQAKQTATQQADTATAQAQTATEQATIATEQAGVATGQADRARSAADRATETVSSGVPDATATTKGKVALSGDLAGTADAPTVPKLASKADLVGGLVPTSQLPAVALTKPHVVPDRAAMLALDAQEGDVCVVTGTADKGTYMLGAGAPTSFSSWVRLSTPDAPVSSVNGQTGVVNLTAGNVGAAPTTHTHTTAQVTGLDTALAGKANTSHAHAVGDVTGLQSALDGKADKTYVDARSPQIQVVTALPASPAAGVVYLVTG